MATETTITRPAPFIEELGTELGRQITAQQGIPLVAQTVAGLGTGPTQRTGETDEQFKLRQELFGKRQDAAQMFEDRQTSIGALAPQVAGLSTREQTARSLADAGVGSFQPFLTSAQQLTGAGAGTGTGSIASFMSPYQSQVIDASLAEFDRQKSIQEQGIRDRAIASGAFGGGREGVQLAEFGAASDRNRAALQAGLLQQGFDQAVARRGQSFRDQVGLASLVPQLTAGDIATQGQLGALDRSLSQGQLDASREAARMAAFQPQEQLDRFAGQVQGLIGGYPGATQTTNIPNPTPLQTALGVGTTLAGIYGAINNPSKISFGFNA